MNMKVEERDSIVYKEIAQGNIPDLLRQPVYLTDSLQDADGKLHGVVLCVLPDFLTIGMNYDFLYSYVAADGSKDSRFIWCDTAYQKNF